MNSQLRMQGSECYWCEEFIHRSAPQFKWFDLTNSADCLFHPLAWDGERLESTDIKAPHMSLSEVHEVIKADALRKQTKPTQPLRAITDNVVTVSRRAQRTSRQAAERLEPNSGTIRYQVYSAIKDNNGMTDYELETLLRGKHQTVSASRRSLVLDGFITDSGVTRKNAQGNDCIVWQINTNLTQGILL